MTNFEPPIPGLDMTVAVDGSLEAPLGGPYNTEMNAKTFQKVWRRIFIEQRYQLFDWVVKIDADAMFWAESIRERISELRLQFGLEPEDKVVFLNKHSGRAPALTLDGLDGPLMVISRGAADAYAADPSRCENRVDIR